MLKRSILATALMFSAGAMAVSMETRQEYQDNFGLMNFMAAGEQASWYWRNVEQVLPVARIKRDGEHYMALERDLIDPELVYGLKHNDLTLNEMMNGDDYSINSMIITQNGKVIFEHFNMPYNTQHVWMSNSKIIAGLLVGMLEDEGKVELQKSMVTYLPELKGTAWADISVYDVLHQQSGMNVLEDAASRQDPNSPVVALFLSETGEVDDYYGNLINTKKLYDAGNAFEYGSINTQMMGLLVARVEDKTLSQVLEERIWSKAGMSADAMMSLTPDGWEVVHGMFVSNTEDMARFAMLFTDSWSATAKERLIPEAVVKNMQTNYTPGIYLANEEMGSHFVKMVGEEPAGAAYQFDAIWEDGDLYKAGLQGQGIYISPEKNMTAVWFSNRAVSERPAAFIRKFVSAQ
ncbi:serine hydrolase domain-containing protein [Thaumasiovibrio sp. DFM-14]|uniref:serine hydrolase domain-containing protein n=1 Tax=Thaumasiovibrio sp. DFM-14 TaxID=3384792 RepID=UPI0039A2603B